MSCSPTGRTTAISQSKTILTPSSGLPRLTAPLADCDASSPLAAVLTRCIWPFASGHNRKTCW